LQVLINAFCLAREKSGGSGEEDDSGYFVADNGVEFSLTPLTKRRQLFEARPPVEARRPVEARPPAASSAGRPVRRPPPPGGVARVVDPCPAVGPTGRTELVSSPVQHLKVHSVKRANVPVRQVEPAPAPFAKNACGPVRQTAPCTKSVGGPVREIETAAHAPCVKSASVPYIQEEKEILERIHVVKQLKERFLQQ
jgi:hypothetical protein